MTDTDSPPEPNPDEPLEGESDEEYELRQTDGC